MKLLCWCACALLLFAGVSFGAPVTDFTLMKSGSDVTLSWSTGTPLFRVVRSNSPTFSSGNILYEGSPPFTDTTSNDAPETLYFYQILSVDVSPPVLTITAPADLSLTNTTSIQVAGTVTDDNGIAEVRVNGQLATITGNIFTATIDLPEGVNTLLVQATDTSSNTANASVGITIDATPPTITAVADSLPNAAGWNNTPVTIHFEAADVLSGVQSITPPIIVTTEGPSQTVTGTATDFAGNIATADYSVNLDLSPPTVLIFSPTDGAVLNATQLDVFGIFSDALAGVASVDCNGSQAVLSASSFFCTVSLNAGLNPIQLIGTDNAGNTTSPSVNVIIDIAPPVLNITSPADGSLLNTTSLQVAGTVSDDNGVAEVRINGAPATVNGGVFSATIDLSEGSNTLFVEATDIAGNISSATNTIVIDVTPPTVIITSPAPGKTTNMATGAVSGDASDENGIQSIEINGSPVAGAGHFDGTVNLIDGANPIHVAAIDGAGNTGTADAAINRYSIPEITITSPADLTWAVSTTIDITGTISDPNATIDVQGTPAPVSGATWAAQDVPLLEGGNFITAVATDSMGRIGTATVRVLRDVTPPHVAIDYPANGAEIQDTKVTVSGLVNDIVLGTVNGEQAHVEVNGISAQVSNRTFLATDVPLTPGANTITAVATDRNGNTNNVSVAVTQQSPTGPRVRIFSGDNQLAAISTELPDPLIIVAEDEAGNPLSGKTVLFKILQNNGTLTSASSSGRLVSDTTNGEGKASFRWTLGTRAGAGNNVVEASSPGISGTVVLHASGGPGTPAQIVLDAGNNQFGVAGQPLPRPFVAVLTDAGHNRLRDFPVTFTVKEGGGNFNGQNEYAVNTDTDGRAVAILTLGPDDGIDSNVVEADFAGNTALPVRFSASAQIAGDPSATKITGVVLDNTNTPIPGVTIRIDETAITTQTDDQGEFTIQPASVGRVKMIADGSTSTRPGSWPTLEYEMVTVAGNNNTIGMPVYLLPIDLAQGLYVDETHGGTITLPDVPGFSLTIIAGSATFPDGSHKGTVSVTIVHPDKVPMTPNFGQQPRLIVTIQPPGVRFEPPAAMTMPNVDGLSPNEIAEMYSFDHDLGSFVAIGTGSVADDGSTLRSDNGVGIIKGGWHCAGNPTPTCTIGDLFVSLRFPAQESQSVTQEAPVAFGKQYVASVGEIVPVTAFGGLTPGNEYSWSVDDTSVADFPNPVRCVGQGRCVAQLVAYAPGIVQVTTTNTNTNTHETKTDRGYILVSPSTGVEELVFSSKQSEQSYFEVTKDNGDTFPGTAQWTQSLSWPVAFLKGKTMDIKVTLHAKQNQHIPPGLHAKIQAQCVLDTTTGSTKSFTADAVVSGDDISATVEVQLPDKNYAYLPLKVVLSVSFTAPQVGVVRFKSAGTTSNNVFLLFSKPTTNGPLYETVLSTGSVGMGGDISTDEQALVDKIWSKFHDRKLFRRDHKQLSYWGSNWQDACQHMDAMLKSDQAVGTCQAFSEFLITVLEAQGVPSSKTVLGVTIIKINYDNPTWAGADYFAVGTWHNGQHIRNTPPAGCATKEVDKLPDGKLSDDYPKGFDFFPWCIAPGKNGVRETLAKPNDFVWSNGIFSVGPDPDADPPDLNGDPYSREAFIVRTVNGGVFGKAWGDASYQYSIAQGDSSAAPGVFLSHYIVHYRTTYYDPSYGLGPFPSAKDHADAAIMGIKSLNRIAPRDDRQERWSVATSTSSSADFIYGDQGLSNP